MSSTSAKRSLSRATTHQLVLNLLLRNGPMSRSELASTMGLSNAAMTYVATQLMDREILVERSSRQVGVGRPPVPLDINYGGFFAVGLVLAGNYVQSVLTDLANRSLRSMTVWVDPTNPAEVAQVSGVIVEFLLKYTQIPPSRLAGVGLAMPGWHDTERGVCLRSPLFDWTDVPIAQMISDIVHAPVRLDNEVNAIATAEYMFGEGRTLSSLGVVDVGRVLDAAFIIDGTLCRRRNGGAGGPGHIRMAAAGPSCECGVAGCLQSFVSESALLAEYAKLSGARGSMSADTLRALSVVGDPTAQLILSRAGRILGEGLVTYINLFDPEVIMISGDNVQFGGAFLDAMLDVVNEQRPLCRIDIKTEVYNRDLRMRGAAALALEDFFNYSDRIDQPPAPMPEPPVV